MAESECRIAAKKNTSDIGRPISTAKNERIFQTDFENVLFVPCATRSSICCGAVVASFRVVLCSTTCNKIVVSDTDLFGTTCHETLGR